MLPQRIPKRECPLLRGRANRESAREQDGECPPPWYERDATVRGLGGGIWGTVFSVLGVNNGIKNSRRERPIGRVREAPPMSRAPLVSRVQSTSGTAHSGSPRRVAKAGITDEPIGRIRTLPLPSPFSSPGRSRCVKSPVFLSARELSLPPPPRPFSTSRRETEVEVGSLSLLFTLLALPLTRRKTRIAERGYRAIEGPLSFYLLVVERPCKAVRDAKRVYTGREGRAHRRGTRTGDGGDVYSCARARAHIGARERAHVCTHVCTHVHMGRVAPRRRRRCRVPPSPAQSHVGGRPPSVLKYPGPGEPSSRAAMPLLSMTATSRARFSSPILSLYSLFLLSLSFSLPPIMHLFPFLILFVLISFPTPAPPTSQPSFFPTLGVLALPCHLSVAPVFTPFVRTPFQGSASLSSSVFPPISPSARSTYSGDPSGTRLASLRSTINRRARNAAQPRERCVNWKAPDDHSRVSRTFGRRCVARARCTELRNPGIYASRSQIHVDGVSRVRVHAIAPRPLHRPGWADVPLCSSTTSTPAVAVAHVINRSFFYCASPTSPRAYHDVPFYRNYR